MLNRLQLVLKYLFWALWFPLSLGIYAVTAFVAQVYCTVRVAWAEHANALWAERTRDE